MEYSDMQIPPTENIGLEGRDEDGDLDGGPQYKAIVCATLEDLNEEVNRLINTGMWYCVGGMRIAGKNTAADMFYQTMVRGEFGVLAR